MFQDAISGERLVHELFAVDQKRVSNFPSRAKVHQHQMDSTLIVIGAGLNQPSGHMLHLAPGQPVCCTRAEHGQEGGVGGAGGGSGQCHERAGQGNSSP